MVHTYLTPESCIVDDNAYSCTGVLKSEGEQFFVNVLHPNVGIHLPVDAVQPYSVDNRGFIVYLYK